jgi:hypothetical protein
LNARYPQIAPTEDNVFDYGLFLIQKILLQFGKTLATFPPMPLSTGNWEILHRNHLLQQEMAYDLADLTLEAEVCQMSFNPNQLAVYNAVLTSVQNNEGKIFFLQSAGGGGKTYVCNTIAAAVRAMGTPVLCVASSAIAALLLDGG